jgi:DNA adenine methylase Dam
LEYIKSPLNYTGGKHRLLPKIIPLFPKEINTFVDLFCGACNVGVNVTANKIVFNDYINYIPELFSKWKNKTSEEVLDYINQTVVKFDLSPTNKTSFEEFRRYYNETKNIEDLFVLICFSFNYQMRFNNNQQYNSSFGKEASTLNSNILKNVTTFVNAIIEKNTYFINSDFRKIQLNKLGANDFIYCDPPYSITCGVYQDGKRGFKGWSKQDDLDLFNLLDTANDKNIKFAMSNMLTSKGLQNEQLIEWSNKYNVHYFDMKYGGCNYQRKTDDKDVEVLITNY